MSQCANWLIRTTSIFLVIPLTSLPECKITILGKQSQENERREVRIYAIKIIPLKEVGLPWGKPTIVLGVFLLTLLLFFFRIF